MDCESSTRVDTSSLYRNGRLVAQSSVAFMVKRCYDVDLKINASTVCCYNKRMVRVCLITTNTGTSVLNNAILRLNITPSCCNCNCIRNTNNRLFYINNLGVGCSENICINLPYPCNIRYKISAQIEVNNVLSKEDCITI